MVADLEALGALESVKPHKLMVPRGDRTGVVIEPMLTDQWFVAMSKPAPEGTFNPGKSITETALDVVRNGQIRFVPENWTTTYYQWLENIQDWCISRQLWWGHQIPAWYGENGEVFVASTEEGARAKAVAAGYTGALKRDEDVLDTWFSSALVPFSSLGWPNQTEELTHFLPSSVLVTGFDIIFFWVARMHVGQPEFAAGKAAGEKAKAAGIKSFLCVNHYATNPASFERCRGFAEAIGANFKTSTLDTGQDPTGVQSKVSAFLRNHPDTQAVLTLGPLSADPTLKALQQMGLAGKIWFATFDFDSDIAKGIQDGTIQFAIDQQPYLQGYIPVAVLAIVKKDHTTDPAKIREILQANPKFKERLATYGLTPSYGPRNIGSGPGFITKANVDKVLKYAGQYR